MRLPGPLASLSSLTLILLAACGGSVNTKLDAPSATSTRVPHRSVPPAATIGESEGVAFCIGNTCDVKPYIPLTATPTASPVPTPVPLPGEACLQHDRSRDEPGIYVFDVTTCVLGRFNAAPSDAYVTWSPDGSKLAFVRFTAPSTEARANVFVLDLQNGVETQVSFEPDERKHSLTWSPDGSKLAFRMRSYRGDGPLQDFGLWVLDLSTSRQTLLLPEL